MNLTITTSEDVLVVNFSNEIVKEFDLESEFYSNFSIVLGVADAKKVFIQRQITAQSIILEDTAIEMKKTKAQPKSVEPILASMHVRCTSIQDSIIIAIRYD
ncbi:hypothetical protein QQG55_36490 [Brugia pahangi]